MADITQKMAPWPPVSVRPRNAWNEFSKLANRWLQVCRSAGPSEHEKAEYAIKTAYSAVGLEAPAYIVWARSPLEGAHFTLQATGRDFLTDFAKKNEGYTRPLISPEVIRYHISRNARCLPVGHIVSGPLHTTHAKWETICRNANARDILAKNYSFSREFLRLENAIDSLALACSAIWMPLEAEFKEQVRRNNAPAVIVKLLEDIFQSACPGSYSVPDLFLAEAASSHWPEAVLAKPLRDVAEESTCWWALEGIAVICEKPVRISLDSRGFLHQAPGAAIEYSEGFNIFSVRGMRIRSELMESPDRISLEFIRRAQNQIIQHALIEAVGYERLIQETNAKPIHRDEAGELYRILIGIARSVFFVKVRNSTPEPDGSHRYYYLRVPPSCRTASAAVAWTFGLDRSDYDPEVET